MNEAFVYTLLSGVDTTLRDLPPLRRHVPLRWPNTVCARFTDSVSDVIKRALGLW